MICRRPAFHGMRPTKKVAAYSMTNSLAKLAGTFDSFSLFETNISSSEQLTSLKFSGCNINVNNLVVA